MVVTQTLYIIQNSESITIRYKNAPDYITSGIPYRHFYYIFKAQPDGAHLNPIIIIYFSCILECTSYEDVEDVYIKVFKIILSAAETSITRLLKWHILLLVLASHFARLRYNDMDDSF